MFVVSAFGVSVKDVAMDIGNVKLILREWFQRWRNWIWG